jgi:hypothetical protein
MEHRTAITKDFEQLNHSRLLGANWIPAFASNSFWPSVRTPIMISSDIERSVEPDPRHGAVEDQPHQPSVAGHRRAGARKAHFAKRLEHHDRPLDFDDAWHHSAGVILRAFGRRA